MADLNLVFGVKEKESGDEILSTLRRVCKSISDSKQLNVKINAKFGKETTTAIRRQVQEISVIANNAVQQVQQANVAMQNNAATAQTRERTNATREQAQVLTQIIGLYGRIMDLTNQLRRDNLSSAEIDQYTKELNVKQEELVVLNEQINSTRELHSLQGRMQNTFLQKQSAGTHIMSGDLRSNLKEYLSLYRETFAMKQKLQSGGLDRDEYAATSADRTAKLERMRVLYAGIAQDQRLLNELQQKQVEISRELTTKQAGVDYSKQKLALSDYLKMQKQVRTLQTQAAAPGATEKFKAAAAEEVNSKRKVMAFLKLQITDEKLLADLKEKQLMIEKEIATKAASRKTPASKTSAQSNTSNLRKEEAALNKYLKVYKEYEMLKARSARPGYAGGKTETAALLAHKEALMGSLKSQIHDTELKNRLTQEEVRINNEILVQKNEMQAKDAERLRQQQDFSSAYARAASFMQKSGGALSRKAPEEFKRFETLMNQFKTKTYEGTPQQAMSQVRELIATYTQAGYTVETFGDKVRRIFSSKYVYGVITYAAFMARRLVREVFKNVKEVDSAMTQLSIVTGQTGATLDASFDKAAASAQKLGANITDLLGSMETFARLGYTMDESQMLSEVATMMSKVADVEVDAATTGLTSIIKGFGLAPEDAEHVGDVLSNIGKKYAVSAGELMEAFERSGAAFKATGTDFEKATALIAAGNAAVQNSMTVGKDKCPAA